MLIKSLKDSSVNSNINLNNKEISSIAFSFINNILQEEWNTKENPHHHNIKPIANTPGPTHHSTKITRILTRLRVGVIRELGYAKYKRRQIWNLDCHVCHSEDTVSHFLLKCHTYDIERGMMLTEPINNILNPPSDKRKMEV